MKTGFVGAGKVGCTLGKFLAQGGVPIAGYFSRSPESARQAAEFTGARQYDTLEELVQACDAIFLTVPDAAIQPVYGLMRGCGIQDKYIGHCSGALSSEEVFPDIEQAGARGFSIHPLFPVSTKFEAYRELAGVFFCLEGDRTALDFFEPVLQGQGAVTRRIDPDNKVRYHAACVAASNFMCALMQVGLDWMAECGFDPRTARDALAPLMRSNMEHLLARGPDGALTGPVERGDALTVARHLAALRGPDRELYRMMSIRLLAIARTMHPERSYTALDALLQEETT